MVPGLQWNGRLKYHRVLTVGRWQGAVVFHFKGIMDNSAPSVGVSALLLIGLAMTCGLFVHAGSKRLGAVDAGEAQAKKDILGALKDPILVEAAGRVMAGVSRSDCWQRESDVVLREAAADGLFWAGGESQRVLPFRAESAFKKCYAIQLFEMSMRGNNPVADGLLGALHARPQPVSPVKS